MSPHRAAVTRDHARLRAVASPGVVPGCSPQVAGGGGRCEDARRSPSFVIISCQGARFAVCWRARCWCLVASLERGDANRTADCDVLVESRTKQDRDRLGAGLVHCGAAQLAAGSTVHQQLYFLAGCGFATDFAGALRQCPPTGRCACVPLRTQRATGATRLRRCPRAAISCAKGHGAPPATHIFALTPRCDCDRPRFLRSYEDAAER